MFPQCSVTILLPSSDAEAIVLKEFSARDIVLSLRNVLRGYVETVLYTAYSFTTVKDKPVSDYAEICTLIPVPAFSEDVEAMRLSLVLKIKLESYTDKTAKEHVQRVRELIENQPSLRSAKEVVSEREPSSKAVAPLVDAELSVDTIGSLYFDVNPGGLVENTLLCFQDESSKTNSPPEDPLRASIRGISFSGYNPPPPGRAILGDLFYLEVLTASDGTLFLTTTAKGFYVNKSTRYIFDPSPLSQTGFSHELFNAIMLSYSKAREAWKHLIHKSIESSSSTNETPIASLISLQARGQLDALLHQVAPQWLSHKETTTPTQHAYNLSRAMDDYSNIHGVQELGPPRDWNEEFQSLRFSESKPEPERVQLAKITNKVSFLLLWNCLFIT